MNCDKCGRELQVGDFPFCKGSSADHDAGRYGVIGDDIPGGVWIKNAICNPDGSPKRYDSKSSIAAAAKTGGWVNHVEHRPLPGTDKSPHTSRWV